MSKTRDLAATEPEEDEELEDFFDNKTTDVFLGFVDTDFESAGEKPTVEDTFFGGQPIWLNDVQPKDDLLVCKNCLGDLALILQANCPLEDELYDRVLYVLGCQNAMCQRKAGSIRCIRGVSKDAVKIEELKKKELEVELKLKEPKKFEFDNPFGNSASSGGSSNPFDTNPFAAAAVSNPFEANPETQEVKQTKQEAKQETKQETKKQIKQAKQTKKLPEYPGFFTYVDKEKFTKPSNKLPDNIKIDPSVIESEAETSSSANDMNLTPEFQSISNSLQDEVFSHFSQVLQQNPLQVLRYDIGGKPLLFSSSDDVFNKIQKDLIPKPGFNPSSHRRFELQIMPKIILNFEKDLNDLTKGLEWVTIIVYTDVEDFVPNLDESEDHVGYVEEWCGVQWEELVN